jgi:glutamate-ammonia-ligase adenylyltransferase
LAHEPLPTGAPLDVSRVAASIGFQDPQSAGRHLERALERFPRPLAEVLPSLLAEAPDPDSALLLFERFASQSEGLPAQLSQQPVLAHYAILVFGHSRYLGETLFREPNLLPALLAEKQLHRSYARQDFHDRLARFRSRSPERDISLLLARFKKREYVRILLRDALRVAPLAETTAEISALSDVLVDAALRAAESALERRYGAPQRLDANSRLQAVPFSVLALGKLGGNELNYSSDIDLLYLHGDGEGNQGSKISNHEYFIRLAQHVTELLAQVTEEGPVFRIDLRLRPQGRDGELTVRLQQALHYYQHTAEDWERQALIKARLTAGDEELARQFIRGVQPGVYTRAINFAAIKTALVAREKMIAHRAKPLGEAVAGNSIDVKLDHGGIRDIEFLVQCLQRVYGGAEPWLRSRGTIFSLQKLHDKGHLSSRDFQELTTAYEFLRQIEHRLQLRFGHQTHRLPGSSTELEILRRAIEGYSAPGERLADLTSRVSQRMAAVSAIYKRIIFQQQARAEEKGEREEFSLRSAPAGGADTSTRLILERLAADSPPLYELAARAGLPAQAKKNLLAFFSSAFSGSGRYAALLQHPAAVERALEIFQTSSYLTDILVRHPEEIATLAEMQGTSGASGSGFLFGAPLEPEGQTGDPVFAHIAVSQAFAAERLSLLRRHYRHRTFVEGVRDLEEGRGVYNSLAAMTAVAGDALGSALGIVNPPGGLAVLALGSLGTREFDLCSDADLLFVREEHEDGESATRAAERLIQALAAYTQDGTAFPVDTRLRPHGAEGELVLTVPQLEAYVAREAQAWEALTYTKLRFVAGNRGVAERAIATVRVLLERFAHEPGFREALQGMRRKLECAGDRDFKTAAGGLYDVEFITAYLLIRQQTPFIGGGGTLRDRIWRCVDAGSLEREDAAKLDHAAELLRSTDHAVRLVTGRAQPWLPATEHARAMTAMVAGKILGRDYRESLESDSDAARSEVRSVYDRVYEMKRD